MPSKETVLVTGAAGFIAYHLISELIQRDVSVIGIDNFDPFYDPTQKEKNIHDLKTLARDHDVDFSFIKSDIADPLPCELSKHHIGTIFHLAAKAGVRPSLITPVDYATTNIIGTIRILELMKRQGTRNLVFASSSSVYGNTTPAPFDEEEAATFPQSPYAASKRSAELYCQTYAALHGIRIAILRYFTVYGPRQRPDLAIHLFTQKMVKKETIDLFVGNGGTKRDYTFVTDTVRGTLQATDWLRNQKLGCCEVFNLGRGQSIGLEELVQVLQRRLRIVASINPLPLQMGDVVLTLANITKAQNTFGYQPLVAIETGIDRFIDWIRELNPSLVTAAL